MEFRIILPANMTGEFKIPLQDKIRLNPGINKLEFEKILK